MSITVKKNISFKKIKKLVDVAAEKLSSKKYDAIICVGRGGMVPSRLMSEALDVRQIYFADAKAYNDDDTLGQFTCELHMPKNVGNVLIVDDCITTGTTLTNVKKMVDKKLSKDSTSDICVLFKNKNLDCDIISSVEYDANKTWLVFPWER